MHQAPVALALGRVRAPVDLVFADPPYADSTAVEDLVSRLARPGLLLRTSVVVLESAGGGEPPPAIGDLALANTRRHGGTRITLYAREE